MPENRRDMIEYLVTKLNEDGMVSDEDNNVGISSTMLENWSEEYSERLRRDGYLGGELFCIGKYFCGHGAIYVLYDTENVSHEDATDYLETLGGRDPGGAS